MACITSVSAAHELLEKDPPFSTQCIEALAHDSLDPMQVPSADMLMQLQGQGQVGYVAIADILELMTQS